MKRICSKCGKVVEYTEKCACNETKKRLKPQKTKQEEENEDLIFKHKYKWWKLREQVIKRDDGFCQRCYHKYGILNDQKLEAHHIKSRKNYPELTFDENNIITLCKTCNLQLGTKDVLDFDWQPPEEDRIIVF